MKPQGVLTTFVLPVMAPRVCPRPSTHPSKNPMPRPCPPRFSISPWARCYPRSDKVRTTPA